MSWHSCLLVFAVFSIAVVEAAYPPKFKHAREEVYHSVGETELKVWIVGEPEPGQLKPAVVLYFGGGWRFGSPSDLESHANYLAKRGFICLLPDYRVFNRNGTRVVSCIEDAKAAFEWTTENAKRLGIDSRYIAAGGASAGGHLAASIALTPDYRAATPPSALLLFNPVLVMAPFEGNNFGFAGRLHERFLGARAESVSPIHHIGKTAPPTWVTHGSADALVPFATAEAFQSEMVKKGHDCHFLAMEGKPHAFHYRDPSFSQVMTGAFAFFKSLGWVESLE